MDRGVEHRGSGRVGMTFTRLASEHFLKVRGNTHLQVELKKKKKRSPNTAAPRPGPAASPRRRRIGRLCGRKGGPVPVPAARGGDGAGLTKRWGPVAVGRLGHVIRLRGGGLGSFPSLSVGLGSGSVWSRAQTRSGEGRGAFTVQDARRRRAEVTRLLLGARLAAPSPGSKPAPLQIRISVTLPRSH